MRSLRICLVSAEVAPFAKTGGLADVVSGLARYLHRAGHDVRIYMPLYRDARERLGETTPSSEQQGVSVRFGGRELTFSVRTAPLPGGGPWVYLVECPELYDRNGYYTGDPDEHLRFAMLCRAALEGCQRMQWAPDVFHGNDWHTGLLPLYLKTLYAWDRLFEPSRTLLTIHNLGYQGVFAEQVLSDLGMGELRRLVDQDDLAQGRVNFLKTGILHADRLSTVSETYAREILTPECGMGLEGVLQRRAEALVGIVNGVDYGDWDPRTDPYLPFHYSIRDLSGKVANKRALLADFDLAPGDVPVLGIVSRLTAQKGFELLPDILPVLLHGDDVRLVVLGSGEERYEGYFQWLRDAFPDKAAFYRGYHEPLAHRIEAGADVFLMPSRYEPCGLNQMYSLRYGTPPVVRRTGGLADTVRPFDPATAQGTGFVFEQFSSDALFSELRRALSLWPDRELWRRLVRNGMGQDFSWDRQGRRYVALYEEMAAAPRAG